MTKKDYIMIADVLAYQRIKASGLYGSPSDPIYPNEPLRVREIAEALADAFEKANPAFKRDVFMDRFGSTPASRGDVR